MNPTAQSTQNSALADAATGSDVRGTGRLRSQSTVVLLLIVPAVLALVLFVIVPLLWIVRISFYEQVDGAYMASAFVLDNYLRFLGDIWYLRHVLWLSVKVAVTATALTIVMAYPIALYAARSSGRLRQVLYTLVLSPVLIGLVSLSFGWIVIFRGGGLLNSFTMWIGLTDQPVRYLYSMRAVFVLLVYIGIPYIVLSLLDNLERIEPQQIEAATNAGANRWQTFRRITLPLTLPGLYAGSLVVFALNFSAFSVPLMVGSPQTNLIGLVVYRQAMRLNNLPFAAAMSVIMVLSSVIILLVYSRLMFRIYLRRLGA